jgi:hypothetical protein
MRARYQGSNPQAGRCHIRWSSAGLPAIWGFYRHDCATMPDKCTYRREGECWSDLDNRDLLVDFEYGPFGYWATVGIIGRTIALWAD